MQVGGLPSDGRSDLYSLGLVVYEMLAGALPFGGRVTQESLIHRMTGKPEGIRKRRPEVPAALDAVVMGCLEPTMEDRFQTGAEIVKALDSEWQGKPAVARRRWLWAALGVAAAAAVVVGVGFVIRPVATPPAPVAPPGMVAAPAGSYLIGSDDDERARPAHRIALPSFAIDSTEVTVGAYRRFVRATNAERPWTTEPESLLPVTGVRWQEAAAFCAWRVRGGRLPTEFEWEAAARGLEGRRYPWGDVMDTAAAEIAHLKAAGPLWVRSHPRGDTPLGVSDLVGNVWEWTSSRLLPYPGGAPQHPGDTLFYVIRGGAYNTVPAFATVFYRAGVAASPPRRSDIAQTGFRCAVSFP